MADFHSEGFSANAVRKLTGFLSVPVVAGNVAPPSPEWLEEQVKEVNSLPKSCCRPNPDTPWALIKRGLMLASERRDLPFVPDAALLCRSHKSLNPWRLRSIFLLLADEVGIKSDRIRKHKGFYGMPPTQTVQEFVHRMTSISSMWLRPRDFQKRFGFAPDMLPFIEGGCEACMLAMIGSRGRLLADLRANIISRTNVARQHARMRSGSAFLRFLDAWIDWFGDEDKARLISVSDALVQELQAVRERSLRERKERKDTKRRLKDAGRKISNPNPDRGRNPLPRAAKSVAIASPPPGGSASVYDLPDRSATTPTRNEPMMSGAVGPDPGMTRVEDWRWQLADNVDPQDPLGGNNEQQQDLEGDADAYDNTNNWASEVGSYYFTPEHPVQGSIPPQESDDHPGARAFWDVHPAFRQSTAGIGPQGQRLPPASEAKPRVPPKDRTSTGSKIRSWFRSSLEVGSPSKRSSRAEDGSNRPPSAAGSTRSAGSSIGRRTRENTRVPSGKVPSSPSTVAAGRSVYGTAPPYPSTEPISQPGREANSPASTRPGGYGNFDNDNRRHSQEVRERYERNIWSPSAPRLNAASVASSEYTDFVPPSESTALAGIVLANEPWLAHDGTDNQHQEARDRAESHKWVPVSRRPTQDTPAQGASTNPADLMRANEPWRVDEGIAPWETHGGPAAMDRNRDGTHEETLAILEGRRRLPSPPARISVRGMLEAIGHRPQRPAQRPPPRPSAYDSDSFRNPFTPRAPAPARSSNTQGRRPLPSPRVPPSAVPAPLRMQTQANPRPPSSVYSQDLPRGQAPRPPTEAGDGASDVTSFRMFIRGSERPVQPDDSVSNVGGLRRQPRATGGMRRPDLAFRRN